MLDFKDYLSELRTKQAALYQEYENISEMIYNLESKGYIPSRLELGHAVKTARIQANLTQTELGTAAGYSAKAAAASISRIENGTQIPRLQKLKNIEMVLNMPETTLTKLVE